MTIKIISELAKTNEDDEDILVLPICLNWKNEENSFDSFVKKILLFQKLGRECLVWAYVCNKSKLLQDTSISS